MLIRDLKRGRARLPRRERVPLLRSGLLTVAMLAFLVAVVGALSLGCGSGESSAAEDASNSSSSSDAGFSGVTLDGTEVSLSDFRGKPLVLVFMATW